MMKPPFAVFHDWFVETSPNPPKEICVEPVRTLAFSPLAAADIVHLLLDTFSSLAQSVRARQDLAEVLCVETRDAKNVHDVLVHEVETRLILQYNPPALHLFYFYLACELFKLGHVGEELLCDALERVDGKSRVLEASNRFATLCQHLHGEEARLRFERAACGKHMLKPIRVLCAFALDFTPLANCYLDLAFKHEQLHRMDQVMFAFAPMFKRMSNEQVKDLLAPAVGRQLKLTTEKSLPSCIELARALVQQNGHVHVAVLDEMFISPARKALKTSSKENVQDMSAKLVQICLEAPMSGEGEDALHQVLKEMLDDIGKEATLFRRSKMISAIANASCTHATTRHKAFSLLTRRAVKDEKTEEAKSLCLQVAQHFLEPKLVVEDGELQQQVLVQLTSSAAGLHLLAHVARAQALSPSAMETLKSKLKMEEASGKLRWPTALVLLSIGAQLPKLDFSAFEDAEDGLVVARILALAPTSKEEEDYYAALAKLLASDQSKLVRDEARRALANNISKQTMLAAVRSGKPFSRIVITEMLPVEKRERDAEYLAMTLILAFRIRRTISFDKSLLPLFPIESRNGVCRFAAPLLMERVEIDAHAMRAAILLDPFPQVHPFLTSKLVERLDYAHVRELDEDEAVIAAFSAPTGRLSEYAEARALAQLESGAGAEDEARARAQRQALKRSQGRKEVHSLENLEWERKMRAEQKQKQAAAAGGDKEKQRAAHVLEALHQEQALKLQVLAEVHEYDEACRCIVHICGIAGEDLSTQVLPLVHLAKHSRFFGASANHVLDAYLSLAFSRDARFANVNRGELVSQLQNGSSFKVLLALDAICQDSIAPLQPELFEFVFPILLAFSRLEEVVEEEEITDAMFRLVSMHRESIVKQKREQLLPGLLKLCARMPAQTSLHCINELFALEPPEETEIATLCGDLGLLNPESTARICALAALSKVARPSPELVTLLWYACSDADERNKTKAEQIFYALTSSNNQALPKDYYRVFISSLLAHKSDHVRVQASVAIALGIDEHPEEAGAVLAHLLAAYHEAKAQLKTAAEKAQLARESKFFDRSLLASSNGKDDADVSWRWRSGIALTLSAFAGHGGLAATPAAQQQQLGGGDESSGSGAHNKEIGPVFERQEAIDSIRFVLEHGTHDPHALVRAQMLAAGTFLVQAYGVDLGEDLLRLVQSHLEAGASTSTTSSNISAEAGNLKREGAVLLFGAAAANLDADDERIPEIAGKLVQALDTPSEAVQRSVVRILPALMKCSKFKQSFAKELVDVCLEKTVGAFAGGRLSNPSARRGNAMGLAAMIKGLGIGSLKHHQLMPRLTEASSHDKWEVRQGALFCFDELCENLGRMFEPYAIQIIEPVFLRMFSDTQAEVREAAHQASKRVMANLSAPGVGMLLPKLLLGLASTEWRTKHAAIQMLGSVSFCAPKQLASSLPLVVPKLIETFTDTHAKVRSAAVIALRDVQSVIKNPEIDRIAPSLISALTDPHEKTKDAVDVLFATRFVHEVDAPSLSLLIPILKRGLKERATETKKKSALIIGNMISMVSDAKAVKPYLEDILPTLKVVLVDPIPGVRVTASKAMGTLVRGLGREGVPDFAQLYQFLIETMHAGASSVERQGGAQGFVEVLAALEDEDLLQDGLELQVFSKISSPDFAQREGAIWGLVFLQTALEDVRPWATRSLDVALLSGLADDVESVRDAAFRCARVYVGEFTTKDPQLVLAALERGLVHPSWRVKHTSVRLLGEFIHQLQKTFWTGGGGAKLNPIPSAPSQQGDGVANSDEEEEEQEHEEEEQEEEVQQESEGFESPADGVLQKLFGNERRNALIATIYLMRNDGSSQVRQAALHVWKSIVFNTPKTLRRIIGPLMHTIVTFLSSSNADQQGMGARALADVVRKLGDRVLPEIVPIVLRGLDSPLESERIGVAMGLLELVGASSKPSLEPQCEPVLFAVEKGLCDESDKVRELAGRTFNKVHVVLGGTITLELVLNKLCADLEQAPEECIRGLAQCVESRSRDSMNYLIPKLLEDKQSAITVNKARALAQCMKVIPDYLYHYLPEIIRLVVREEVEILDIFTSANVFVYDTFSGNADSIRVFCRETCSAHANTESASVKRASLTLLAAFFASEHDVLSVEDASVCFQSIVKSFASREDEVLQASIRAFALLVKHVNKNLASFVSPVRQAINALISDEKYRGGAFASDELRSKYELPAFQQKACLDAMLELYLGPLVSNQVPHEIREIASIGLGEIVDVTGADALKTHTVKIAGPLIRIVGEPFPSSLKISILATLTKLLGKQGAVLRPFLSQLQTTFVKALKNNTSDSVRVCGLQALDVLLPLTPRVDPLVNELCQGCELNSESGLQMLQALYSVFHQRGREVTLAGMTKVLDSQILLVENNVEEEKEEADDEISSEQGAISVLLAMLEGKICELALASTTAAAAETTGEGEAALVDLLASRLAQRLETPTWRNLLVLDAVLRGSNSSAFVSDAAVCAVLEQALQGSTNPRVRAVALDCASAFPRRSAALQAALSSASRTEKDSRVRHFAQTANNAHALAAMREDFKALF